MGTTPESTSTLLSPASSIASSSIPPLSTGSTSKGPPSTTSPAEPEETRSKPNTSPAPGGLSALFPHVARSNPYDIDKAPDGRNVLKAHFKRGSYRLLDSPLGRFSFYAKGPDTVDLADAKEATFAYRVNFSQDSISIGEESYLGYTEAMDPRHVQAAVVQRHAFPLASCGEKTETANCTHTFRQAIPRMISFAISSPPRSAILSMARALLAVAERVKLNDMGESNGEVQLWVNGRSVIDVKGVVLRARGAGKMRGVQFQIFFGGSNPDWASPKDQDAYFADFSVAITELF
ncbi:hypothetical protein NMY22_g18254 [Coprinellus aureogranulatus]|nr:hypothetical protein NMY22_g18254 [Coprinellus aureogranulatus]